MSDETLPAGRATTGIPGLDGILAGGLERRRLYLVEGKPGTGKTTFGLAYLLAGLAAGERCLYVALSESGAELRAAAASHGWSLDHPGLVVFEVSPPELADPSLGQSLLHAADLELGEAVSRIFAQIEAHRPTRVVIDGLSEIRLLSQGPLRYRQQLLAMKHRFAHTGVTVLLLNDMTTDDADAAVHSIAHGVVRLEELAPAYGAERRRLRVVKYRGTRFRGGYHDLVLDTGGLRVFPRLVAADQEGRQLGTGAGSRALHQQVPSGLPGLDNLLGGGLQRGTNTLLMGPSGAGKSVIALHYALAATAAGGAAVIYVFDEEISLVVARAAGMGLDLAGPMASGRLRLESVDAAELSPGEFAHRVRDEVELRGVDTVVVDSLNGFQAAMPDEHFLLLHVHELLTYLNRRNVLTLVTLAQHGLVGEMRSPVDFTYISDTIVLLRYFEAQGRVRRAMSVIKKRIGRHEDTIREYRIGLSGVQVGEPMTGLQGVLRGTPQYLAGGAGGMLLEPGDRTAD
ncbi:ATPase domain-containing protein [Roseomonas sp. BN140053]|uniref:ATPase domain-containing protein n=1 Tax=Roseomonas sp. BN140053 TaxID=3391898 RepID=UPI0039ED46A4